MVLNKKILNQTINVGEKFKENKLAKNVARKLSAHFKTVVKPTPNKAKANFNNDLLKLVDLINKDIQANNFSNLWDLATELRLDESRVLRGSAAKFVHRSANSRQYTKHKIRPREP